MHQKYKLLLIEHVHIICFGVIVSWVDYSQCFVVNICIHIPGCKWRSIVWICIRAKSVLNKSFRGKLNTFYSQYAFPTNCMVSEVIKQNGCIHCVINLRTIGLILVAFYTEGLCSSIPPVLCCLYKNTRTWIWFTDILN